MRIRQSLGRTCIQALGSLSLLLVGLAAASPRSEALDHPGIATLPVDTRATQSRRNVDHKFESDIVVARAETRQRREQGFEEGAEADMEPSAEPGLEFEGDFEFKVDWLENTALGQRPGDDARFSEQEVALGLSYRRDRFLAFGEIKLLADQAVFADDTPRISE